MDRFRAYRIEINGGVVGELRRDAPLTLELMPGTYTVRARLDWCVSEPLEVRVRAGQTVRYEVCNPWSAAFALYSVTLGAQRYLKITAMAQDA
jgi:hypothetical protein